MLRNKPFWISVILLGTYLLAGYFAGPRWLQPALESKSLEWLGRELRYESIRVDPITLSFRLTGVKLVESKQPLFPGLEMSAGEVQLRMGFLRLRPEIAHLEISGLELRILPQKNNGETHAYPFGDLLRQHLERLGRYPDARLFPVRHISLSQAHLDQSWQGGRVPTPLLEVTDLEVTGPDTDGRRKFGFRVGMPGGASGHFEGMLDPGEQVAEGQAEINGVRIKHLLVPGTLPAEPTHAVAGMQAAGRFRASLESHGMKLALEAGQLRWPEQQACIHVEMLCVELSAAEAELDATVELDSQQVFLQQARLESGPFGFDASLAARQLGVAANERVETLAVTLAKPGETGGSRYGVTGPSSTGEGRNLVFKMRLGNGLMIETNTRFEPFAGAARGEFVTSGSMKGEGSFSLVATDHRDAQSSLEFHFSNPGADLLSPQLEELGLDRRISASDLAVTLRLEGDLESHTYRLGESVEITGLKQLPAPIPVPTSIDTGWLLALLEDPQAKARIVIPPTALLFENPVSLHKVMQDFFLERIQEFVNHPFAALQAAAVPDTGQPGDRGQDLAAPLHFAPGSAEADSRLMMQLDGLARGLQQRPGLGLAIRGTYDPLIDRKALQSEQLRTHIALATAAGLSFQEGTEPPDFNDSIVQSVMDEFAARRLPAGVLETYNNQFGAASEDEGIQPEGKSVAYYETLFEILAEYAQVPEGALNTLARYRSQAIADGLVQRGVSAERLYTREQPVTVGASLDGVPLALALQAVSAAANASNIPVTGN